MRPAFFKPLAVILPLLAALLARTQAADGCAVCYGNPDSAMVQGAASGIIFLAAVIYTLLFGFVGIALFWGFRARKLRLSQSDSAHPPENEPGT